MLLLIAVRSRRIFLKHAKTTTLVEQERITDDAIRDGQVADQADRPQNAAPKEGLQIAHANVRQIRRELTSDRIGLGTKLGDYRCR